MPKPGSAFVVPPGGGTLLRAPVGRTRTHQGGDGDDGGHVSVHGGHGAALTGPAAARPCERGRDVVGAGRRLALRKMTRSTRSCPARSRSSPEDGSELPRAPWTRRPSKPSPATTG